MGAGEINSATTESLVGRPDRPALTGDPAYRLLLKINDMISDLKLKQFVTDPKVNY